MIDQASIEMIPPTIGPPFTLYIWVSRVQAKLSKQMIDECTESEPRK